MSMVYIISSDDGESKKYKIGFTTKPINQRLKQMKTGNPFHLEVEKVYHTKFATKLEAILHRQYSHLKIQGEWYDLTDKELNNFEDNCKSFEDYYKYLFEDSTFTNPKTFMI